MPNVLSICIAEIAEIPDLRHIFPLVRHLFRWIVVPLRQKRVTNCILSIMDNELIFSVALTTAMFVLLLALVFIIIYFRWKLGDKNATLDRFIDENAELRRKIHRTSVSFALLCIMASAAAQTPTTVSWRSSDRFPELPPLRAEFNTAMHNHHQPNLLITSQDTTDMTTAAASSIMFLHKEKNIKSNFQISSRRYMPNGDALIGIRDYIVRDRRIKEGHPLPPPTPVMRR